MDETVTVCGTSNPMTGGFGDAPTDASGQVSDDLEVSAAGGIPDALCIELDQVLTAGGCGPLLHNTIVYQPGTHAP